MNSIILKAIMERYGGLKPLYEQMSEDEDVVLLNLSSDVNEKFSETEILEMIHSTL